MRHCPPGTVKNKSIPNVDDERLLSSLGGLHAMYHTAEGLHAFDGPRRQMVDNGRKILLIVAELRRRDVRSSIDCRWCAS